MAVQVYIPTGIVHTTSVDFIARQISKPVYLVQGDVSLPIIAVELNKDGQAYAVPSNADVNIRLNKKDGTYIYNTALGVDSSRTIAYFEVTEQTAVVAGTFDPELEIVVGGTLAGSSKFKLIIEQQALQEGMIESSTEAKALIKQVEIAKGYAEDAEESATNAANSATASAKSATSSANSARSASNSATSAATSEANTQRYATAITDNLQVLNTVANNITDVNTIATSIDDVNSVAAEITAVSTVSNNLTPITKVSDNISDVNTVAASIADINSVADKLTDISSVADNLTPVSTVASDISNVDTVSSNIVDVNTVASDIANVNTTATNIADVNSVAANMTNVSTVSTNIDDISTAADNITTIQNASANAQTASDKALVSEGYAIGTQNETPVTSGTYFENNSKYYSDLSRQYMESARAIAFETIDTEMSDASGNVVENRTIKHYVDEIASQSTAKAMKITLPSTDWDEDGQQTIAVSDITSDDIIVSFSTQAECLSIGINSLTFRYLGKLPEEDIVVDILIP